MPVSETRLGYDFVFYCVFLVICVTIAVNKIHGDRYVVPEIMDNFFQLSLKKVDNSLPSPVMTVEPMSTAPCKPCVKFPKKTTATPSAVSVP